MERIVRKVRPRHMWAFVVVWLGFSAWFFSAGPYAVMADQGGVPDEEFGRSAADVSARVEAMSDGQLQDYKVFLGVDILFAVLYGLALAAIGARACRVFLPVGWWWTPAVPLAAAGFDVLENAAMTLLIGGASAWPFVVAQQLKLMLAVAAFAGAAVAAVALTIHAVTHPVKRSRA